MSKKQNLSVAYMGLHLDNPLIAGSGPLTASAERIAELEAAGIGAVVLKSIFEEQISGEAAMLGRYNDYPEAADYLRTYIGKDYLDGFVKLIKDVKQGCRLPVIASINCAGTGKWIEYAKRLQDAGADALELNIYFLPVDAGLSSADIEARYLDIVAAVTEAVTMPVSVKLSMRFTNIAHMAREIYNRKAQGAVLYNRFFEPDIDLETLEYVSGDAISSPKELQGTLRYVAITTGAVPELDISVSRGVHTGADVVKSILAGAQTVQICSTLLVNGMGVIREMTDFISSFMDRNTFDSISDFRGLMNKKVRYDDELLERVQYMKFFPGQ